MIPVQGPKVPDYTVARSGRIIQQAALRHHLCNRPVRLLPDHQSIFGARAGLQGNKFRFDFRSESMQGNALVGGSERR